MFPTWQTTCLWRRLLCNTCYSMSCRQQAISTRSCIIRWMSSSEGKCVSACLILKISPWPMPGRALSGSGCLGSGSAVLSSGLVYHF